MGLKKIFSHSSKENNLSASHNSIRRNSSKSSSISQSISNWTHKEKEKLKHHSANSNNSTSRLSTSSVSSAQTPAPIAPPRSIKVTQHETLPIVPPHQQETDSPQEIDSQEQTDNTNPFLSTSPSGSTKDVTDVVNVLRTSLNSDASLSTTISEDEKHTHFNHITDVPTAIQEEEQENNNPFLTTPPSSSSSVKRQSQVFYPPPNNRNLFNNGDDLQDNGNKLGFKYT